MLSNNDRRSGDKTAPAIQPLPAIRSLDELRDLLKRLPGPDLQAEALAAARDSQLTKPAGSLGRLEEIVLWLCRWQGQHPPRMDRPQTCVFAGNHGIAAEGVSAFPISVTAQMVENFRRGGAAINQLSAALSAKVTVVPLDLDRPVRNFAESAAMDEEECVAAFNAGAAAVDPSASLLCPGEMGIGNTTAASAICHGLWGGDPADWCGRGSGVSSAVVERKAALIARAAERHGPALHDGLDVLRILGGREIAAMAGAIVAARLLRIPVMLDGFICCAAAAALHDVDPDSLAHCMVGHASLERGHQRLLRELDRKPLLDLNLRLGEGTGGVLAATIAKSAVACHNGMATFAEAGVDGA
ncbi:nicotinate-nucleotide--dimethylbenzimidazole phosphoribosyltransferase [Dongia sp.]|uniref:nicotinate-nucleotide--dimethylbenzimidazole phosphoribosyltransferase n=1 Tax=Dongia sp. TaxID=1977262 RepID=UPI0035AEDCF8